MAWIVTAPESTSVHPASWPYESLQIPVAWLEVRSFRFSGLAWFVYARLSETERRKVEAKTRR
jgi:hypothetical protein